jgi:hypothetical protein
MLSYFKSNFQYKRLYADRNTSDEILQDENSSPILIEKGLGVSWRSWITRSRFIFSLIITLVSLSIVYVWSTSIQFRIQAQNRPRITHCGSTPAEARALGCKFEVHNFAWVPPDCFDDQLAAEWDADPSWAFSRNMTAQPNISPPDLYTREEGESGDLQHAIVPWRQHVAHCAFIMRKYQRSVMMNRPMDNWTYSYHHTSHCADNFLRWDIDPWNYNSVLHLKFPECDYRWQNEGAEDLHGQ